MCYQLLRTGEREMRWDLQIWQPGIAAIKRDQIGLLISISIIQSTYTSTSHNIHMPPLGTIWNEDDAKGVSDNQEYGTQLSLRLSKSRGLPNSMACLRPAALREIKKKVGGGVPVPLLSSTGHMAMEVSPSSSTTRRHNPRGDPSWLA